MCPSPVDVDANCSKMCYSETATFETSSYNLMLIYFFFNYLRETSAHRERDGGTAAQLWGLNNV